MPNVKAMRLNSWLPLWVAWHEDDWGNQHHIRLGWSAEHATTRSIAASF